jgi:hypothetical protein
VDWHEHIPDAMHTVIDAHEHLDMPVAPRTAALRLRMMLLTQHDQMAAEEVRQYLSSALLLSRVSAGQVSLVLDMSTRHAPLCRAQALSS